MKLKKIYIKKLNSIGIETNNLYMEDFEDKSTVAFADEKKW